MFAAFTLFMISYGLVFFVCDFGTDTKARIAAIFGLTVHQITTMVQVYVRPLPTVNGDPVSLNHYASKTGGEHLQGNKIANDLRRAYEIFDGNHLFGCEIAQVGFALSLVFLVKLCHQTKSSKPLASIICLYSLVPSSVLNTSVILRESWQMAGYLGLTFCLLSLRQEGLTPKLILTPFLIFILSYVHNGFGPIIILTVPFVVMWGLKSIEGSREIALVLALFFGATLGNKAFNALKTRSVLLQKVAEGRAFNYINEYSDNVARAASDFPVRLDISSINATLTTGPATLAYYLYSPFIWDVKRPIDLYGLPESFLRIWLTLLTIAGLIKTKPNEEKNQRKILLWMWLAAELVWAAGTANWGTAIRHRLPAFGLLLISGLKARESMKAEGSKTSEEPQKQNKPKQNNSPRSRRRETNKKMRERNQRINARKSRRNP